eukprot:3272285-Ditylum_brightwellii.AAC.1
MSFHCPTPVGYTDDNLILFIAVVCCNVNLSPVSKGSNPDIGNWDNVQSTIYISATPLAIEQ